MANNNNNIIFTPFLPPKKKPDRDSEWRKLKDKSRNRINIGEAFTRWRDLKEEKSMPTDAEVALFLLDRLAAPPPQAAAPTPSPEDIIVNIDCLLQLFQRCEQCRRESVIQTQGDRTCLSVTQHCQSCNHLRTWASNVSSVQTHRGNGEEPQNTQVAEMQVALPSEDTDGALPSEDTDGALELTGSLQMEVTVDQPPRPGGSGTSLVREKKEGNKGAEENKKVTEVVLDSETDSAQSQEENGLSSQENEGGEERKGKSLGVWPFATEEEYQVTAAILKRFGEGIGKDLHQKLLQRGRTHRNWLEEWWLDAAYLELRYPSQLNVNFGGPAPYLEHCWPPTEGVQLQRNSISMWHTLQYWDLLRTERLDPHKNGNVVLDMDQFRMLFCTCKVPGVTKDTIINYFKTESEGPCPSHVVVMCKGRFFSFDAVCDGHILTPPELLRQLTYVKQCCEGEPAGDGVAALTSEERTRWVKAREYLIGIDPANKTLLETIQSSLFVVSLDDAKPYATAENYTPVSLEVLIGDPTIHWGDKSYNSIADGTFGSNCDGSETVRPMPLPEELVFTVDDRVRSDIAHAKQQYFETTQDLQVVCYAFTSFGKAAIKQRKLHPDTFIQLALQLAYYRQHGRSGSCYETAMTRRFYHGRTETMRPCTLEAQNWCRIMLNPVASAEAKRKALLLAFNKHNKLMAEAQNGKGFDRHLLGLYLIAKEEGLPMPDLFTDPLYSKRIVASCSAWKSSPETDAETLFQNLVTSLHEMLHLATTAQL
ncbi:peroxisomal carnitine O-octanoyltransferase-like [Coregonus clupeaformis]|uniref:peroxisomal carnitine O-octanoyltransferase-like n=1 Tax=Coregonus clupeaformis TaxID=59861 RepID=UPI001E1C3BD7|nr:peroxisomal carnitine O-octanoyltransferase-like [Coregonus clupeaformis]